MPLLGSLLESLCKAYGSVYTGVERAERWLSNFDYTKRAFAAWVRTKVPAVNFMVPSKIEKT